MPSSRYSHIPLVLSVVRQLQPTSILDVGVGFGKWGHLFREYLDIVESEKDPARYFKRDWQIRIDGIEGFPGYVTPAHEYFYDTIHLGDMRDRLRMLGKYDIIFLGDVIEHLPMKDGIAFLQQCLEHANKAVVASTPAKDTGQGALCHNPLEAHHCVWSRRDFHALSRCVSTIAEDDILVAVLLKPDQRRPVLRTVVRPSHQTSLVRAVKKMVRFTLVRLGLREPLPPPSHQTSLVRAVRKMVRPALVRLGLREPLRQETPFESAAHWEEHYAAGGNSGLGSYGKLADFKARVINGLVSSRSIKTVVEFGTGDGNQLALLKMPHYVGVDVSLTIIQRLREQFGEDATKQFLHSSDPAVSALKADLALSLDVIYHLVEDNVYYRYMDQLFSAATRYVIIYSSDSGSNKDGLHVRHRHFTEHVANRYSGWRLIETIPNEFPSESPSSFFIYQTERE